MEFHEAASIFPLMEGEEYEDFKADIKAHGLAEALIVHEGKVLDGRNRYRAAEEIGLPYKTEPWDGKGSPADFVLTKNLHRRQLTVRQRGMVAARTREFYEREAKKRQDEGRQAGASKGGQTAGKGRPKQPCASKDAQGSAPAKTGTKATSVGRKRSGRSRASADVGKVLGVSAATVDRARVVLDHGCDELVAAVDRDEMPLLAAAKLASKLPKGKQLPIVREGKAAVTKEAKRLCPPSRSSKRKQKTPALIKSLVKDIMRVIDRVRKSDKGVSAQRKEMIGFLQSAAKRIKEAAGFLT